MICFISEYQAGSSHRRAIDGDISGTCRMASSANPCPFFGQWHPPRRVLAGAPTRSTGILTASLAGVNLQWTGSASSSGVLISNVMSKWCEAIADIFTFSNSIALQDSLLQQRIALVQRAAYCWSLHATNATGQLDMLLSTRDPSRLPKLEQRVGRRRWQRQIPTAWVKSSNNETQDSI